MMMEIPTPVMDVCSGVGDRQEMIRQLVDSRTGGRIHGLQVLVEGSRIVISGRATTYYSKQLATHAALDVAETLVIQNDVVVGTLPR